MVKRRWIKPCKFQKQQKPVPEPEAATRAYSEPRDDGRRIIMKRDQRKLGEETTEKIKAIEPQRLPAQDRYTPSTVHGSNLEHETIENEIPADNIPSSALQPVVGNDFQPPKRILAKLLATPTAAYLQSP